MMLAKIDDEVLKSLGVEPKKERIPVEPDSHIEVGAGCSWPRPRLPPSNLLAMNYLETRVWHVLSTAPRCERKAADWLKQDRLAVYFPNYVRQIKLRGGMRREIIVPVVSGYLFLACRPGIAFAELVERIPGLLGWLRDEHQRPAVLSEQEILGIRMLEAGHNLPEPPPKPAYAYVVGERVKVVEGLHLDWQGEVVEVDKSGRISIEVLMLGRRVIVRVTAEQIEPIEPKAGGKVASPG